MWRELLTAALYYMPFLVTIGFALFALLIGIFTILSGTFLVLAFALYGVYAVLRDQGILRKVGGYAQGLWTYVDKTILENFQKSFVLKDIENLPSEKALYCCHPHGLTGFSWFFHLSFEMSPWPSKSPRPYLAMHSIFFKIPFAREILTAFHCIEATESEILRVLSEGHSVAIILGGVEEMTYGGQYPPKLVLKKRKGYARLAKQAGVPLVPLYNEGDEKLFQPETFWLWRVLSQWMYKLTNIQIPLPSWQSMRSFAGILREPLKEQVKTFVLKPIETKHKEESEIRKEYGKTIREFLKYQNLQADIIG